ncbi:Methionine--tRNA ligase, cytoplasmic [Manis javanica]|nr:Methionine--tRNA ligase, cytoplasmic [Manis javanica]
MQLCDRVNEYVDANKPRELAKQEGMDARLQDVCTTCIEAFRLLTIYLKPILPAVAEQVEGFLNVAPLRFADAQNPLGAGHAIGLYKHLMQRVDVKQLEALFEAPEPVVEKVLPGGEGFRNHRHRRLRQGGPAHRQDRGMQARGRLHQAAAAHAGRGGEGKTQRVLRHLQHVPARAVAGQAHRDGGQPGAAQNEFGISEGMVLAASHA